MELPAGGPDEGVLLRSRSAFARHCTVSGAVLVAIGIVGIARWWAMSVGLLLLWMAAMVAVITHEELQVPDELEHEVNGALPIGAPARSASPTGALVTTPPSTVDASPSIGPEGDVFIASPVPAARSTAPPASPRSPRPPSPEQVEQVEQVEQPEQPEHVDQPEHVQHVQRAGQPERTTVRFRLPLGVGSESVFLVGDFNGWSTTDTPMRRSAGGFVAEVVLQRGATYRYRYLLDDGRWENDWSADRYAPNEFGSEDSVIDVPAVDDASITDRGHADHGA